MAALPPRVLLLEDDPLMQRFVAYALEDTGLELTCCNSVSQAMQAFTQQSFTWILTDLMLPGESGLSFIEKISLMPEQLGTAQIVALSAGIDRAMQDKLSTLGVLRQLLKPVSVKTLQELLCADNALTERNTSTEDGRAHAITTYFAGQTVLYEKFAQQCREQFSQDIINGDLWLKDKDHAAMHNAAHSLKSVLRLLGEQAPYRCAETLEKLTTNPPLSAQAATEWLALKKHLNLLAANHQG